jgi:tRNA uridine 5-carbamoylmethylation protein Kti12
MKLLVICGQKGAGKDTLAAKLINEGWIQIAYADILKEALMVLFGWDKSYFEHNKKEVIDYEWNTTPRQMCQLLGTEFLRHTCSFLNTDVEHPDNKSIFKATFHIKRVHQKITQLISDNPNVKIVITDGRFEDEIEYVRWMGGSVIKIVRPSIVTNEYSNHPSETYINQLNKVDLLINNDGTISNLWRKLDGFLSEHD